MQFLHTQVGQEEVAALLEECGAPAALLALLRASAAQQAAREAGAEAEDGPRPDLQVCVALLCRACVN